MHDIVIKMSSYRNSVDELTNKYSTEEKKASCSAVSDSLRPCGVYSPPGSSVHGILQARILEWVAITFSKGSSQTRDQTCVFWPALQEPPGKSQSMSMQASKSNCFIMPSCVTLPGNLPTSIYRYVKLISYTLISYLYIRVSVVM